MPSSVRSLSALALLTLLVAPALAAQAAPAPGAKAAPTAPAPVLRAPLFPRDDPRVQVVSLAGSLPKARNVAVLLPRDYATSGRRYPVLYLLHGMGGAYDNWLTRTNLLEYTADLPLIVVMPDAGDSWYGNSVTDTMQKFQKYIAEDVVNYVDSNYRTLPFAQGRFIAGLSMGGYGSVMLATKYPNRYALAASFSGAVGMVGKTNDSPSVNAAFGPPGAPSRDSSDLPALLRRVDPKGLPYYYLDCGTGDRLVQGNRDVIGILAERGLPYEYHETRGVHDWEYWNRRIPVVLQLVAERMRMLGR